VDLDEVAVIYQKHSQAENILKALEQKQISVNVKKAVNILYEPLIEQIVSLLSYI
jgi:ATP-dependent exoDNAse (exonuclease V) beta subunit